MGFFKRESDARPDGFEAVMFSEELVGRGLRPDSDLEANKLEELVALLLLFKPANPVKPLKTFPVPCIMEEKGILADSCYLFVFCR